MRASEARHEGSNPSPAAINIHMKIDYIHSKEAPVMVCFIKYNNKFLLLERSDKVLAYKNLWSALAGFLDDSKTVEEKAIEEITEELGLKGSDIVQIVEGPTYIFNDENLDREWERHLVLAEISNPNITLDWEHADFKWINPEEVTQYETTPGFAADLEKVRNL